MPWHDYVWTPAILRHVAEHGVSREDFEQIVNEPLTEGRSRSHPGREIVWGYTDDGRYVACVFEREKDKMTIVPVTAYETREPRGDR